MGFRSVLISEDTSLTLPEWFVEKHENWLNFSPRYGNYGDESNLPIASKGETKEYFRYDLYTDLQKVLTDAPGTRANGLELVWFHECGGITKVHITPDKVKFLEPESWHVVDSATHGDWCCWECSYALTEEEKYEKERYERGMCLQGHPPGSVE